MSQRVSVYGPNVGHGGEFHVHRSGCADTKRGEYPFVEPPWTVEATSQQAVIENIYSDIIPENPGSTWETYADTVRFFPCTALPTAEPAATCHCGSPARTDNDSGVCDEWPGCETWTPVYESWRHGGWYVVNVTYPSGAVGCVSRNFPDRKWRIVCDERPGDHTYPNRDAAARAEREIANQRCRAGTMMVPEHGGTYGTRVYCDWQTGHDGDLHVDKAFAVCWTDEANEDLDDLRQLRVSA